MKKKYIVIFARIPNTTNWQDGMIQRELAIDNICKDIPRIYIEKAVDINFLKYPRQWIKTAFNLKNEPPSLINTANVKIYYTILKKQLHKLLKDADKIYVHSLYHLGYIPEEFINKYKEKIILDIHGCVVEEIKYNKEHEKLISKYEILEKNFYKINSLVAVSNSMIDFYCKKYPNIQTNFITLPVFTKLKNEYNVKHFEKRFNILYSGGAQKWQNVDLMVDSISKIADKYNITILTPAVDIFKDKLKKYNLEDKVTVKTVPASEIYKEYEKSHLGYILRDDIIVNKVACPTKLVEYLSCGIIPIVLQPSIGDFETLGYSYILNEDLINGKLPSIEKLEEMRRNNFKVIEELDKIQQQGKETLLKILQ